MTSITDLATKIEAAKLAGNGITLSDDELHGFLRFAALLGGGSGDGSPAVMLPPSPAENDEIITIEEICAKLKISRQTLYRWRRDGTFTLPPVNARGTKWLASEFSRWLRERSA